MLVQKFLELIGIEIGEHPVARHKSWNISLVGKLFHLGVCLSILTDINNVETVSFLGEVLLRVNAPRAPFATVKLQFHGDCGNKQERSASSIAEERGFPSRRSRQCREALPDTPRLFSKAGERRQYYEEVCDGDSRHHHSG